VPGFERAPRKYRDHRRGDAGLTASTIEDDGRVLTPRLRALLYGAAAIVITCWLSLEFLGAAGFVAFSVAMIIAQVAFRWRGSLNVAFAAAMIGYALTVAVWSAAIGPPRPSNLHATQTVEAEPGIP
jgi:hypothetical protein